MGWVSSGILNVWANKAGRGEKNRLNFAQVTLDELQLAAVPTSPLILSACLKCNGLHAV
jgi:ribosomal protein S5